MQLGLATMHCDHAPWRLKWSAFYYFMGDPYNCNLGSSGHIDEPAGMLTENHRTRSEDLPMIHRCVKSLLKGGQKIMTACAAAVRDDHWPHHLDTNAIQDDSLARFGAPLRALATKINSELGLSPPALSTFHPTRQPYVHCHRPNP